MHEITKYLKSFIKQNFSNEIKQIEKHHINKSTNNQIVTQILNDIRDADVSWNKIHNTIIIEDVHESSSKQNITTSYISENIKGILLKYNNITQKCVFSINKQLITVHLSYLDSNKHNKSNISKSKIDKFFKDRIKLIYLWLHVSNKYRDSNCSNTITIYIYLSDLYKTLPEKGKQLEEFNVNTAITTSCIKNGKIYIYREEEWFKVLIHETFHVFGLDFTNRSHVQTDYQQIMDKKVSDFISIKTDLRFFETYCEINAEWLNILFYTYFNSFGQTNENILKSFYKNLVYEKMFSIIQSEKILNHYGVNYMDIFNTDSNNIENINKKYKEKTYCLSYIILKSIYMFNLENLFEWNHIKNGNSLRIKLTEENTNSFADILKQNYNNPEYLKFLNKSREWLIRNENKNNIETKTCRMSLFEI